MKKLLIVLLCLPLLFTTCKKVKGLLQEDKQAKYGIRLLKVLD